MYDHAPEQPHGVKANLRLKAIELCVNTDAAKQDAFPQRKAIHEQLSKRDDVRNAIRARTWISGMKTAVRRFQFWPPCTGHRST